MASKFLGGRKAALARYRQKHVTELLQYNRTYNKQKHQERKLKLLALFGGSCVDCGYSGHPVALDFDHRDPTAKMFEISKNMRCSWAKLVAEAEKCDIRCANCHRLKTFLEVR